MTFKTLFTYDRGKTVWRLLLNGASLLLIEERDLEKKETSFSCYNLETGERVADSLTFEEPFWIGVEEFRGDIIYFHHYRKPDMPHHQDVFAYSLSRKEILWHNPSLIFGFYHNGRVYAYRQEFESAYYFALDEKTGDIMEEPGGDTARITELRLRARDEQDYSAFVFPEQYSAGTDPVIDALTGKNARGALPEIETLLFEGLLFFTVHRPNKNGTYDQELFCVAVDSKKVIFTEVINKNQRALLFDSFFIYDRNLILLYDKKKVIVHKL